MTRWQKERLAEQLKFFGAKKTKFISVYARKPRILCKAKVKVERSAIRTALYNQSDGYRQIAMMHQSLFDRGMQNSAFAQTKMGISNQLNSIGTLSAFGGLGGLFGMGGFGATRQ